MSAPGAFGTRGPAGRSWASTALGCLAYLALFGGLAAGIDRWMAPLVVPHARPWLGLAAAFCFTMSAGAVWGLVTGLAGRGGSRSAILERAETGTLPDEEDVAVITGTVRAATAPLQAPISGTPCVAYAYRMFYEHRNRQERRVEVPVYWGLASRPFTVDTRRRAVRVMAVPWLVDEPKKLAGADALLRARQFVKATRFEEASGLLGAVASAVKTVRVIFQDDDGEYRSDYRDPGAARDPDTLFLEESVLPVGARASLSGTWSPDRGAIVVPPGAAGALVVTTGPVDALLKRNNALPASKTSSVAAALVFAALGTACLWAATRVFIPGGPLS